MKMKSNQGALEIYPYHAVENAIAFRLDSENKSEIHVITVNMLMEFLRRGESNE